MPTKQEANAAAQQELQRVVRAHAAHAPSAAATADADADLLRAIRGFMSNNDWAEKASPSSQTRPPPPMTNPNPEKGPRLTHHPTNH